MISTPIISEINSVNNCGYSSLKRGKNNNLPLVLTKSQNPQTKNLKFKGVPGTFRRRDYRHWIPKPILTKNGFDSPPPSILLCPSFKITYLASQQNVDIFKIQKHGIYLLDSLDGHYDICFVRLL